MKAPISPNTRVRTHLGDIGVVTGPHGTKPDRYLVRMAGAFDTQTPPRWEGELLEDYHFDELITLS